MKGLIQHSERRRGGRKHDGFSVQRARIAPSLTVPWEADVRHDDQARGGSGISRSLCPLHTWRWLSFQAGQFKIPVPWENLEDNRQLDFLMRTRSRRAPRRLLAVADHLRLVAVLRQPRLPSRPRGSHPRRRFRSAAPCCATSSWSATVSAPTSSSVAAARRSSWLTNPPPVLLWRASRGRATPGCSARRALRLQPSRQRRFNSAGGPTTCTAHQTPPTRRGGRGLEARRCAPQVIPARPLVEGIRGPVGVAEVRPLGPERERETRARLRLRPGSGGRPRRHLGRHGSPSFTTGQASASHFSGARYVSRPNGASTTARPEGQESHPPVPRGP